MMQNLSQMTDIIDPLATAGKSEPENIGHLVGSLPMTTVTLVSCSFIPHVEEMWLVLSKVNLKCVVSQWH